MRVFFYLSGEHQTLPKAEALAALEALGESYKVLDHFDQVLALKVDGLGDAHARLAMCHVICELSGVSDANYEDALEISKLVEVEGSFAARVKRIKHYHEELSTARLEKLIGGTIKERGFEVDLDNPNEVILGILSEKFALGRVIEEVDRSQYEARRPHKRPYFKPGAMLPRNCRAIVNLTRVKGGGAFVDPFCGTGGFLIEAGLLGAKIYGYDSDHEALEGCEENLEHYGMEDFHLERMDARELGEKYPGMFDALATDLPYGISSSTRGQRLNGLYSQSLGSFYETLRKGGYACVVSPYEIDIPGIAKRYGFAFVDEHL
ncbi:MAG: methyltransferase domain-containing protein, partial [Anaerolineae bacterium]